MRGGRCLALLLCGLLCGLPVPRAAAAQEAPAYPPVRPGTVLQFPRDHGAHPDYRTEWWYITGWLTDEKGAERGFQLTFFRVRTLIGEDNPSRFAPRQLVLAHAAVSDPALGRLRHAERAARAMPPLAGAASGRTEVHVRDWFLAGGEGEATPYRARIAAADFAFELEFQPSGPPLLNGHGGVSRKAADPTHASYYYSRPQLAVRGTLTLDGAPRPVSGHAWLDHEWSSAYLPEGARGWDWIGINLHGGGALMAFRMRDGDEGTLWTAVTLRDGGEDFRAEGPAAIAFRPLRRWRSPRSGADYPVEWALTLPTPAGTRELRLRPLMDDQELDSSRSTGAIYWEGAVRLVELRDGGETEIGRGYLEMTGYAERLRM
jgi:predicted secreted hydrolase